MKITAVSDNFMLPEFYTETFAKYPELELLGIPQFGSNSRFEMRAIADTLEKHGAYSVPVPDEIYKYLPETEILMVHLCPVTKQMLEAAPKLKYILTNRGGLENIDMQAVRERKITLINNPAHNGNAVAELTVALMICETRNVARTNHYMKNAQWREDFPNYGRVFELRHKTIGIVGFGTIGRLVAEKLQPFHVDLIATDPNVDKDDEDLKKYNVRLTTLDEVMSSSDIVTVHARTIDKTQIIGRRELELMKPTSTFINTARAYLVDYDALADILQKKKITGASLEVFPVEPIPSDSPFIKLDNVTLTNHRGGDTVNCYSDSPSDVLNMLFSYLKTGKKPKYLVE